MIQFQVVTNNIGSPYPAVSAAVGDFDLDGRMDVASVVQSNLFIFKGQGNGVLSHRASYSLETFRSAVVAVGNFNGDARPDLLAAMAGVLQIWAGNGDGTFVPGYRFSVNAAPNEMVIGDFNNDGRQDAVLIKSESKSVISATEYSEVLTVVPGGPDSSFRAPIFHPLAYRPSGRVAVGDFNRDGSLDVVLGQSRIGTPTGTVAVVNVLLGNGDGSFSDGARFYAGALEISDLRAGDFNGDGVADVLTAHFDMGYVGCLLGNGDGKFQWPIHSPAGLHPSSLVVGDFNGDGYLDVISADNVYGEIWVLEGDGTGHFRRSDQPLESHYPYVIETADFDNDRRADFLGLSTADAVLQTYINRTLPSLYITRGRQQVVLSWRAQADFVLESSSDLLSMTSWTVTNELITESNGVKQIMLPAGNPCQFFRLKTRAP